MCRLHAAINVDCFCICLRTCSHKMSRKTTSLMCEVHGPLPCFATAVPARSTSRGGNKNENCNGHLSLPRLQALVSTGTLGATSTHPRERVKRSCDAYRLARKICGKRNDVGLVGLRGQSRGVGRRDICLPPTATLQQSLSFALAFTGSLRGAPASSWNNGWHPLVGKHLLHTLTLMCCWMSPEALAMSCQFKLFCRPLPATFTS